MGQHATSQIAAQLVRHEARHRLIGLVAPREERLEVLAYDAVKHRRMRVRGRRCRGSSKRTHIHPLARWLPAAGVPHVAVRARGSDPRDGQFSRKFERTTTAEALREARGAKTGVVLAFCLLAGVERGVVMAPAEGLRSRRGGRDGC